MVFAVEQQCSTVRRAPVSAPLDTSLTGTQCLASTQPETTGWVQAFPSITPESPAEMIKVTTNLNTSTLC